MVKVTSSSFWVPGKTRGVTGARQVPSKSHGPSGSDPADIPHQSSPRGRSLLWRDRGHKALLWPNMGNTFIIGAFTRPRCYFWLTPLAMKSWTTHLISWPLFMCIFHIGKVGMVTLGRSLPWKYEAASFKTLQSYKAEHSTRRVSWKTRLAAQPPTPSLAIARFPRKNWPPHTSIPDCWGCVFHWGLAPASVSRSKRRATWLGRDGQSYSWTTGQVFYL